MKGYYAETFITNTSSIAIVLAGLLFLFCPSSSEAAIDKAAAYCESLGYTVVVEETEYGPMKMCEFPDGQRVSVHAFVVGKAGLEWSYCRVKGLQAKHVEDSAVCKSCCVCVFNDGEEVEVMKLMGLNSAETSCGDGICGVPENYEHCPADCPSGGWDGYCDAVADNNVDPDCRQREDPDAVAVIPGDQDNDGDVDRNDLNIVVGFRNKPATVCAACDLDDDFIITALDARKLVLLCTRSRCATK
jgi:putative hemolysin